MELKGIWEGNRVCGSGRCGTGLTLTRARVSRVHQACVHVLALLLQMPGVTVKDVNQQEFVRALAAFLKK
jgi:hypothetical protein